eukprot:1058019-Pleurochrysis_carterae.AAC.1
MFGVSEVRERQAREARNEPARCLNARSTASSAAYNSKEYPFRRKLWPIATISAYMQFLADANTHETVMND